MTSTQNTLQEDTNFLMWKTFSIWEIKNTDTSESIKLHYDESYGYKRVSNHNTNFAQ